MINSILAHTDNVKICMKATESKLLATALMKSIKVDILKTELKAKYLGNKIS